MNLTQHQKAAYAGIGLGILALVMTNTLVGPPMWDYSAQKMHVTGHVVDAKPFNDLAGALRIVGNAFGVVAIMLGVWQWIVHFKQTKQDKK